MAAAGKSRRVLRLYRELLRLAGDYPESAVAWKSQRIPMNDDLRVEIRTSFKDNMEETEPERISKYIQDGERLKKMLQLCYQDAFFRMYPTVRPYHQWAGKSPREVSRLKEPLST
eukprot:Hpha_TRINITY_DN5451_c0_g1::TRINITY_DN5451_c0_g1_i1::g.192510::m.192510